MGVSTLHASNIKGKIFEFVHASHPASCVNWALFMEKVALGVLVLTLPIGPWPVEILSHHLSEPDVQQIIQHLLKLNFCLTKCVIYRYFI